MLTGPIAFERFQPVPGKRRKVDKAPRLMQLIQFATSSVLDSLKPFTEFIVEKLLRLRASERTNHIYIV